MRVVRTFLDTRRGYRISLTVIEPALPSGKLPLLLLSHGLGVDHRYPLLQTIVGRFTRRGYCVAYFDFAGHGKTGGGILKRLVGNFYRDTLDVLRYLGTDSPYRGSKIVLVGHSIGALVALLAAARRPRNLAGVVAIASNAESEKKYLAMQRAGKTEEYATFTRIGRRKVHPDFWRDRRRYVPKQFIPKISVPVLFMCGSADTINTPRESRLLYRWAHAPRTLTIVGGADHYFRTERLRFTVSKRIEQWLARQKKISH
ncbi:MAG: alpha/beta fold hydrolase [Patescibacteria group bacterium]